MAQTCAMGGGLADNGDSPARPPWTFLTNHAHVLLAVAADPDVRVNDIATAVGITPRAALLILRDLEEAGYLTRTRTGRRTHYEVRRHQPFRHPATASHDVDELLAIFLDRRAD
jgi:predicted ArsR family transcriptional regulator